MKTAKMQHVLVLMILSIVIINASQDFSNVLPRTEIPGFWKGRLIQPIKNYPSKFDRGSRIVGGEETKPNDHPYQVGLLMVIHWWTGLCGGCLLSKNIVVTAAHCLDESTSTQVIMGAHRIFTFEPTQVRKTVVRDNYIVHPDYDPRMLYNDVALLKLNTDVTFNEFIQPIQLPKNELLDKKFSEEIAVVSGACIDFRMLLNVLIARIILKTYSRMGKDFRFK